MATQNPQLPPGSWVQYDVTVQDPRAPLPGIAEQGIGQVKQSFTKEDGTYYQVVWTSGLMKPKVGLYRADQLKQIDDKSAADIRSQIANGTYQYTATGTPGSNFQAPALPQQAEPPSDQPVGRYAL